MTEQNVLIIAHGFPPTSGAGVHRPLRFVKYLPEFGWRPIVVSARCEGRLAGRRDEALLSQIPREAVVIRTKDWMPYDRLINTFRRASGDGDSSFTDSSLTGKADHSQRTAASRAFQSVKNMASFLLANPDRSSSWRYTALPTACRVVRQYDPAVIMATSPPHSAQLLASWTKRLTGVPLICDFRDPWNRTPLLNRLRGRFRENSEERMEQFCIRTADRIILNTPQLEAEFRAYYPGSTGEKLHVIPNGFDPEVAAAIQQLPGKELQTRSRIVACHPGTLYAGRDIRPVVRAIARLKSEGIELDLHQIGPVLNVDLLKYAREHGAAENVRWTPKLPLRETHAAMAQSDLLLAIQFDAPLQVPGKVYEMLMFRKPIVALDKDGATASLVRNFGIGTVADCESEDDIVRAFRFAVTDRRTIIDSAGWEMALEKFNGRNQTRELASILDAVVAQSDCR